MIQVNSSQFNHMYNNRIHFPYSVSMLVSHIKSKKELANHFQFEKTFVFREKIEDYIKQYRDSEILLCSCYVWNWEITTYLTRKIKEQNPNCLVIFGGPQVPRQSKGFFEKFPFVDIIVQGEGEYILAEIFEAYLKDENYSKIKGIETKDFKNPYAERINDLETIPSPYLSNLVWELVEKVDGVQWIASWETNRGCPYQCTFCDWGSATNTKMRGWSEERLMKEIEWFSENKIPYIDCCDANFGIYLERDSRLAEKLNEVSLKRGYPETFRPNWAKFSSEKIIPIARKLQEVGLLRAVTLSVQSLDETTLQIIKRENIKFNKFSELTEAFDSGGIPTYSEIILGLPGETVQSFKKGLEIMATDTKIGSIQIYNCSLLPNAPMNDPHYVEHFKIKSVRSPIDTVHAQINNKGIDEYEEIVIGTSSYSFEDLKEMYLYAWLIQTFHSLGISEFIWQFYNRTRNLSFLSFYDSLLEFCKESHSLFSEEFEKMKNYMDKGYAGKGWNHRDSKLGDIYWPIEEASWLRLIYNKNKLQECLLLFLNHVETKHRFQTESPILQNLVKFQVFLLTTKDVPKSIKSENFEFNWKEFFMNTSNLEQIKKQYWYKNQVNEKDPYQWNYNAIWFGRFKKLFKISPEKLHEEKLEFELTQKN